MTAEQAHTPTNDEREALLRDLYTLRGWTGGDVVRRIEIIDRAMAALGAPFEVPEPSADLHVDHHDDELTRERDHHGIDPDPQGHPSSEVVHRGTFGHVWPCPLFYIGNWKSIENGHRPVRECTSPAECAHPVPQGEPSSEVPEPSVGVHATSRWAETVQIIESVALPQGSLPTHDAEMITDAILARSECLHWTPEPQGEPSDAKVEAAARRLFGATVDSMDRARELARVALTAPPLVACPHWAPGKITFRNGCTACAEAGGER